MPSYIQILKVGEVQDKAFEGRAYQVQEAECVLLDENGETDCIGVLRFSEAFRKNPPARGVYVPVFSMVASPKDRKIGSVITGLTPVSMENIKRKAASALGAATAAVVAAVKV